MEFAEDGTFDFTLGQDAWHQPDRIQPNQYAKGVNVSVRSGSLGPRPAFHEFMHRFDGETFRTKYYQTRTYQEVWESGKFQAMIPYYNAPDHYVIWVIGGLIFSTSISTHKTTLLSKDIVLDQYASRINWSYAGKYIVLFDWPDYPILIDGTSVRRADPLHRVSGLLQPEIPISMMGGFNGNRLFVINGVEFTAGDPVGSLDTPEAPVTFTEVLLPSQSFTNQSFALDTNDATYPITAIGFIQQIDASTEIGPTFLATQKKIYVFKTNQPRENWDKGNFSTIILANAGIIGPRAFVNVNSDLIFMSEGGYLRALTTARNDSQKWGNTPISREVANYLKFWDKDLSKFAALGYFDNRVFITANPYRNQALDRDAQPVSDYAHGGLVSLDLESTASLLSQGTPVWEGLWTGIHPMDFATVGERFFVVSKDWAGLNVMYELRPDKTADRARGVKKRIRSIVYTREYICQNPSGLKEEHSINLHLKKLGGRVDLKIERKPSHGARFVPYAHWSHNAPIESCDIPPDALANGFATHEIRQLVFGDAEESACSPVTQDDYAVFRATQFRLTIEAEKWALDAFKLRARPLPAQERGDEFCEALPAVEIPFDPEPDWLTPEESLCPGR